MSSRFVTDAAADAAERQEEPQSRRAAIQRKGSLAKTSERLRLGERFA